MLADLVLGCVVCELGGSFLDDFQVTSDRVGPRFDDRPLGVLAVDVRVPLAAAPLLLGPPATWLCQRIPVVDVQNTARVRDIRIHRAFCRRAVPATVRPDDADHPSVRSH